MNRTPNTQKHKHKQLFFFCLIAMEKNRRVLAFGAQENKKKKNDTNQ